MFKFIYLISINEVFIQLLGEDQRLIVVFQMLVMATQVDELYLRPVPQVTLSFSASRWKTYE